MPGLRAAALAAFLTGGALVAAPPTAKGYRLVFEDNFDGTQLDAAKWGHNYPWGRTHNHRAAMRPEQVKVAGGLLTLTAIAQRTLASPDGYWDSGFNKYIPFDYTSGAVHTDGRRRFKHGYLEGRFKMPRPQSTWPAFWTLQDGWPPEIDILEVQGDRRRFYYNFHYGPDWTQHQSFGGEFWGPPLDAGWHTYALEWTPDELIVHFDEEQVARYWRPGELAQAQAMYLIINLAVGGWAPDPVAAEYPATFHCDWVRVWQSDAPVLGGTFRLRNRRSGKFLDVAGSSTAAGGNVVQAAESTSSSQLWAITTTGEAFTRLLNVRSGKALDVWDWSQADGGDLRQWDPTGGNNQQFRFEKTAAGYYRLINRHSGKAVAVLNGATTSGADVIQWGWTGADDQEWELVPPAPRVLATATAAGVKLTWPATRGVTYRVQATSSLPAASWSDASEDMVATGTTASQTVSADAGMRFLRVTAVR